MAGRGNNKTKKSGNEHVKLENRLVLLSWLNSRFGYESNYDLLKDTREVAEGFDGEGRSHIGTGSLRFFSDRR